jgi:glucose-6-phosphate 1-dehydrogenase
MEPPADENGPSIDAARVALLQAVQPLRPADVVRGQYVGYQTEPGVAPTSRVETYVAAQITIQTARWIGVPFLIRAGKRLAATATEVHVIFKPPVNGLFDARAAGRSDEICFRLGSDVSVSLTARIKKPGEAMVGENVRLFEHRHPSDDMQPYERLLGDAMHGDRTLFGSEAGVEAAWRIVDPILNLDKPPASYDAGSWGPDQAGGLASQVGGWIPASPIAERMDRES